jgi:hypothetical protein
MQRQQQKKQQQKQMWKQKKDKKNLIRFNLKNKIKTRKIRKTTTIFLW